MIPIPVTPPKGAVGGVIDRATERSDGEVTKQSACKGAVTGRRVSVASFVFSIRKSQSASMEAHGTAALSALHRGAVDSAQR